jgi:hypothetical protein
MVAARLRVFWSEEFRELQNTEQKFGIDEAAEVASLEVSYQTGMRGE